MVDLQLIHSPIIYKIYLTEIVLIYIHHLPERMQTVVPNHVVKKSILYKIDGC